MLSLQQLKNNDFEHGANMTNLEKIVKAFLTPEISLEAIELAKKMAKEELEEGLSLYYDNSTANLFNSCLNWSNIDIFLKTDNQNLIVAVKEWLVIQENFKQVKGQINLKTYNFKINDSAVGSTLQTLNYDIDLSEVANFKEQLSLLDESDDQYFDAVLNYNGKSFNLTLGQKETVIAERISFWKQNLVTAIKAGVLVTAIFAMSEVKADEQTKAAISTATKAVMAQPEVKEMVSKTIKSAEKNTKEFVKETGSEIPATIVGYGLKSALDGKVQMKGKGLKKLGVPLDYDIAVGFDSSYSLGVGGENPYMKGSDYKIEGSHTSGEQKIQMKVNFEF